MEYNTQTTQQLKWLAALHPALGFQISPDTFAANPFCKIEFLDDLIVAKRHLTCAKQADAIFYWPNLTVALFQFWCQMGRRLQI